MKYIKREVTYCCAKVYIRKNYNRNSKMQHLLFLWSLIMMNLSTPSCTIKFTVTNYRPQASDLITSDL